MQAKRITGVSAIIEAVVLFSSEEVPFLQMDILKSACACKQVG